MKHGNLKLRTTTNRPARRAHIFLDAKADAALETNIVQYTQLMRRPVSMSLIIRRALEVLAERMLDLPEEEREMEAAALARGTK